jgi:hypothetical protein
MEATDVTKLRERDGETSRRLLLDQRWKSASKLTERALSEPPLTAELSPALETNVIVFEEGGRFL